MTAFASSDDAVDGYRHLEEYIFQTARNHDREVRQGIRLWKWQDMQVMVVKDHIGTNKVEVLLRAFSMGLNNLRPKTAENLDGLNDIVTTSFYTFGNMHNSMRGVGDFESAVLGLNYDLNVTSEWELSDSSGAAFRDSELSEVQDSYVTDLFMGSWIKRALIAIGMGESKASTNRTDRNVKKLVDDISRITTEAREDFERELTGIIAYNHQFWKDEGIRKKNYGKLVEIKNMMETDCKNTVEYLLDDLEDSVE